MDLPAGTVSSSGRAASGPGAALARSSTAGGRGASGSTRRSGGLAVAGPVPFRSTPRPELPPIDTRYSLYRSLKTIA